MFNSNSVIEVFCVFFIFSITEHIDFATPLQEPAAEPLCNANLAASMHTLDHLSGVANRASIHYTGESQLLEVANKDSLTEIIVNDKESFQQHSLSPPVWTRFCRTLAKISIRLSPLSRSAHASLKSWRR